MKKAKSIIILLTVLLVLLLVYFVASPMWSDDGAEDTTAENTYTVAAIDHTLLVGLELKYGETSLSFSLNDTATEWDWSDNAEIPLDNMTFATIVTALNNASSKYKLEGVSAEQLADYGLDAPALTVKFIFSGSAAKEYYIGNLNSFNGYYYLSEASAPNTVYMVEATVKSSLELEIYDFVLEETAPAITEAKIVGVDYTNAGNYRDFIYYPSGNSSDYTDRYEWYFRSGLVEMSSLPPEMPLDTTIGDTLSSLVTGLTFDECVGLDYTAEDYGFSEGKKLVISYNVDENETGVLQKKDYVIYLGSQREDGSIYAHTETSKLVYTLSSSDEWLEIIGVEETKLYPDELWLPNYELINSMTFTAGGKTVKVDLKNTDGKISYSSDYSDDTDAITALVAALEDISAISNVAYLDEGAASGENTEIFAVKVTFTSGETSEIRVTKYSAEYCLVEFGIMNGRLVTLEDAEAFAAMITAIPEKAA